jgi:hypothetical protein
LIFFACNAYERSGMSFGEILKLVDQGFPHFGSQLQEAQGVGDG